MKSHLTLAAPELEKRGWRGVFCVVTDKVGRDDSLLSWDDVRELVRRGHGITPETGGWKPFPDLAQFIEFPDDVKVAEKAGDVRVGMAGYPR